MAIVRKVRERVRRYFNPDKFDPTLFRLMMMFGVLMLLVTEVVIFTLLRQSSELGELPNYITDALIIGISLLEFFVAPLISWLGYGRRRRVLVCWTAVVLFCTLPMFALPGPEAPIDDGLCTTVAPLAFAGVSTITAIRLSMLLILGLVSALARTAYISHVLTYLDEHNPSVNLHMHVAIFVLCRVMVYLISSTFEYVVLNQLWLQLSFIVFTHLSTLIKLFRYPKAAPVVIIQSGSDRGLFSSMGRVLSNGVVVLQILAMSQLVAAYWGFGMHEAAFVQVKYYIVPNNESQFAKVIKLLSVVLGIVLAGYIYTTPLMAKFDRKAAVSNVFKLCGVAAVLYFLLTYVLECNRSGIGGLEDLKYNQPACGLNCSCDRPWMEFTPVCVPEEMTTYFSPCHAGCASADTVNSIGVFSNCTCAPGGRVTIGACNDGSCAQQYFMHQMLYVVAALINTLAFAWQATVIMESVDKKDVAVAIGLTSAFVSLFAFVGAHGFYMGISSFTCAFASGSKCLLQNDRFPNWVGYTSVVLALCALVFSVVTFFVLRRQKETNVAELSL